LSRLLTTPFLDPSPTSKSPVPARDRRTHWAIRRQTEKGIFSSGSVKPLCRRVTTYRRAPSSPTSAARDLPSKISNVLAYFSRYAFVNDLAHGLP